MEYIYSKQVGQRIRAVRKKKKLRQVDLAARTNLQQAAISAIEQGRSKLSVDNLFQIAKALDVSPQSLLLIDNSYTPQDVAELYEIDPLFRAVSDVFLDTRPPDRD